MRWLLALLLVLIATPVWAAFPTTTAPTASIETTGVTTHNIAVPACTSGKLYLILSLFDATAGTVTWPNNANDSTTELASTTHNGSVSSVRYRFANGSDAQIDVTSGNAVQSLHHVYCVTGAHASAPPEAGTYAVNTTTLTPDAPSATASWGADDNLYFVVTASPSSPVPTLSTCPAGFSTSCTGSTTPNANLATGRGTSQNATENPGTFTFTGTAIGWRSNTVVVRPAAALIIPPTGFSTVTGNSWQQAGGVATPVDNFSVVRWDTASGPDQQAACTITAIPDADGKTFQISFRIVSASTRSRFFVTRIAGANNDTATLQEIVGGVITTLAGPINLGVDIQSGDRIGVDVASNAIKGTYWSVDSAWATLCAGGGDWCTVATGTATTTPGESYVGMGAESTASCTLFAGTLSAAGPDTAPPSTPANCTAALGAPANTQLVLTCDASTDNFGVVSYRDEQCAGSGCTSWAQIRDTAATTWLASDLTPDTLYRHRRCAWDGVQCSAFSTVFEGTTLTSADTVAPSVPQNCATSGATVSSLTLVCDPSTDAVGVVSYRDESCTGTGCTTFSLIRDSPSTTYVDEGLTPGTLYRYRRAACDLVQCSAVSAIFEGTTTDPPTPAAPTGLTIIVP